MDLKTGVLFPYAFWIAKAADSHSRSVKELINDWCNENCTGQWLIIDTGSYQNDFIQVTYYSKALNDFPIKDAVYGPATIDKSMHYLLAFELEEEATAFKLRWDE